MSRSDPFFPVINLTVDGMRHQLQVALAGHFDGIKAALEENVKRAFDNFDFERTVQEQATRCIADEIRRSVERAVADAFRDEAMRKIVLETVSMAITEQFKRMQRTGELPSSPA